MAPTGDRPISPITLDHAWSEVFRLLFLGAGSVFSVTCNGFFVASFFVESMLKKIGLIFLACAGSADLIITGGVMPTSTVVILSRSWDTDQVCYFLQFLTEASTYSYSLFFSLSSAESYFRLCRPSTEYNRFVSMRMCTVAVAVFSIAFITAGVGVFFGLDYDCCRRLHFGNFYFRIVTDVTFHLIPGVFTLFFLISSSVVMRRRARSQGRFRRSKIDSNQCLNNLNIAAFIIYSAAWLPYLITVYESPAASDKRFYYAVWLGVGRSCLTSLMYGLLDSNFRRAFGYLFKYCCCKNSLSYTTRRRRRNNQRMYVYMDARDLRVHIMHRALPSNSPQRGAAAIPQAVEL